MSFFLNGIGSKGGACNSEWKLGATYAEKTLMNNKIRHDSGSWIR